VGVRDRFPAKMSRSAARKFMDVYNNDPTGLINLIEALANGAFDQPPADANVNSDRADYNHAGYRR
jgi:mRNA-degrading endonuclease HigB of HigAB toxin-antitoxin module